MSYCCYFCRPVDFIGPLVYRVLFTISATIHYFIIILLAIAAFATCFNLQQTRKDVDMPVDSFYGSLMQVLFMATGGFDLDFIADADSPLFTSIFFFAFVLFVILIFLIILISATTESYNVAYLKSLGAWRAEQARVILQKSFLLPNEENLKPFHNPKWLHILAPVGPIADLRGQNIDDENIITGHPALCGQEGGRGCCECEDSGELNSATQKFITKEIDEVQDMISELNNQIAAKACCVDMDELADKVAARLLESYKQCAPPMRSPRLPDGPMPREYSRQPTRVLRDDPPERDSSSEEEILPAEKPKPKQKPVPDPTPSPAASPTKPAGHSSIRIRSIKSSKKKFSRQISSSTQDSDDENEEKERQYRKKLIHDS